MNRQLHYNSWIGENVSECCWNAKHKICKPEINFEDKGCKCLCHEASKKSSDKKLRYSDEIIIK